MTTINQASQALVVWREKLATLKVGDEVGNLKVTRVHVSPIAQRYDIFEFECACGDKDVKFSREFLHKSVRKSCKFRCQFALLKGQLIAKPMLPIKPPRIPTVGEKFGKLTVVANLGQHEVGKKEKRLHYRVQVVCECQKGFALDYSHLYNTSKHKTMQCVSCGRKEYHARINQKVTTANVNKILGMIVERETKYLGLIRTMNHLLINAMPVHSTGAEQKEWFKAFSDVQNLTKDMI